MLSDIAKCDAVMEDNLWNTVCQWLKVWVNRNILYLSPDLDE